MLQQVEITKEYIRNIDNENKNVDFSYLEEAPPCRTYYDFGDQLKNYVQSTFIGRLRQGDAEKNAIVDSLDIPALEARSKKLRNRMLSLIGGLPSGSEPLNALTTGQEAASGYRMEKIIFTARPGVYITGNIYVPENLKEKTGAVLFVCGHAKLAKGYAIYQRVCHSLARAGLVAFIIDPVGQGERFSYLDEGGNIQVEWGCPEHDYVGAQTILTGFSCARYFVHDAMRAVDYLISRPEVDETRIGITGSSGGGTQTALMMMLDKRIAAAAPGTFICSLEAIMRSGIVQDAEQIWNGLVEDGFDHDDILLMSAPKPVILLGASYDFFPVEGLRHTYESAKRFYKLYGKEQNLSLFIDDSVHQYSKNLALKATDFFSRIFLGRPFDSPDAMDFTFSPKQCTCTNSGQIRLDYPNARFIFHENRDIAAHIVEKRKTLSDEKRRTAATAWLKERIYYNRLGCETNLRRVSCLGVNGMSAETLFYWSNKGILSNILYFSDAEANKAPEHVVLALWENGTGNLSAHQGYLQEQCSRGKAVAVLDLSGSGALAPNRINTMPMHDFEGTLCGFSQHMLWQNDSLTALRSYEILMAISVLECELGIPRKNIEVYAEGYPVIPAASAVILSKEKLCGAEFAKLPPEIERQVTDQFYDSHDIMNKIFPGALSFFDVSDLVHWAKN